MVSADTTQSTGGGQYASYLPGLYPIYLSVAWRRIDMVCSAWLNGEQMKPFAVPDEINK